jgi:hypothetical protein
MKTYATSAAIPRPTGEILQAALTVLTNNGFTIVNRDEFTAHLTGPGLNSTKQNPLLGASRIHLALAGNQMRLDAELGGVETMRRFLMTFPFLLGLGLGLLFAILMGFFGQQSGDGLGGSSAEGWTWILMVFGYTMIPVAPWLVLSPLIVKRIRTRTQQALDALLTNAIQMTKPA